MMVISLTHRAATHITTLLKKRGKGLGLRIGVRTSGCTGMAYVLEFVDKLPSDDIVIEDKGIKIYIDKKSFLYINGTEVDFIKEELTEGFKFTNPNVKYRCGCGESFSV